MGFYTQLADEGFYHEANRGRHCDLSFEIRGKLAPFIEITLLPGEGVVCDRISVLQHEAPVEIKNWPGLGQSRWLVVNSSDEPEASVMLTTRDVGYAGAFDLGDFDGRLICPLPNLMANGPGVTARYYARFAQLGLDLVLLEGNGWVFLRSFGDVFEYLLAPGEKISIRAHSIAAMSPTIDLDPVQKINSPANGQETDFSTLTGPGSVWLQSLPRAIEVRPPAKISDHDFNVQSGVSNINRAI